MTGSQGPVPSRSQEISDRGCLLVNLEYHERTVMQKINSMASSKNK